MTEEFQPELDAKDTLGLVGLLVRCVLLVPAVAIGVIYAVLSYQGAVLGRREWKEIVFIVWVGTMVGMVILVLRRKRTGKIEPGGELLAFPLSKRNRRK